MQQTTNISRYAPIIVIGGGVIGCSVLYHLAKAGISDAILLERHQLTCGTTWHSAAQVRALRSTASLTTLARYSIELYSQLEKETGQSTGWINEGSLSIATTPERLTHIKRQQALARLFGVRAESASPQQAREKWPLMNDCDVIGAVWSPDDGRVSPSDLCAALVKASRKNGAKIFENTEVTAIMTKNDKVKAVETKLGVINCDAVVICGGLWSRQIASMAKVEIPLWPCEHFYLVTKPIDAIKGNMPTLSDHDNHLYIRDDSGGLLIGCFEPLAKAISPAQLGDDFAFQLLPEDWQHFEPMMVNALHRLPILQHAEVKMLLNGPESFTPDGAFLLGEAAETKGVFLACGMNSIGVASAGGAGMAIAHYITKGKMPFDLHEVDPKRFPQCWNNIKTLAQRVPEVLGKHYEISFPYRQYESSRNLRQNILQQKWQEYKPHFGQFYGWERPLYFNKNEEPKLSFNKSDCFNQIGDEVMLAHQKVAMFDQSSLGKIDVTGSGATAFLNEICTNQMDCKLESIVYTAILNQQAGIETDLIALRLAQNHYRLFVGTADTKRDITLLQRNSENHRVFINDVTEQYSHFALAGPDSITVMQNLLADEILSLPYYRSCEAIIGGIALRALRLSYVGEKGWEISCETQKMPLLYDIFHRQGVRPAGLLAQSAMRIEKGFLAYGHDIDTDISPLQAGIGFAIDWQKDFIGKKQLLKQKIDNQQNRLKLLVLNDQNAVPIGHEPVYYQGEIVGKTTSAAFGYRMQKPVAIADIKLKEARQKNQILHIDIAGQIYQAKISECFDQKGTIMSSQNM